MACCVSFFSCLSCKLLRKERGQETHEAALPFLLPFKYSWVCMQYVSVYMPTCLSLCRLHKYCMEVKTCVQAGSPYFKTVWLLQAALLTHQLFPPMVISLVPSPYFPADFRLDRKISPLNESWNGNRDWVRGYMVMFCVK